MASISRRFFIGLLGAELATTALAQQHSGWGHRKPAPPEPADFNNIAGYPSVQPGTAPVEMWSDSYTIADHDADQWRHYLAHRQDYAPALKKMAAGHDAAANTVNGWQNMLSHASLMRDPFAQAKTLFDWVCQNIDDDEAKGKRDRILSHEEIRNWLRPAHETLRLHKGVCGDKTVLLMEGLLLLGFAPNTFKMVGMLVTHSSDNTKNEPNQTGHAVLDLHLKSKNLVFDTTSKIGIWKETGYYGNHRAPITAIGFDKIYQYGKSSGKLVSYPANDDVVPVLFTLSRHDQAQYDHIASLSHTPPADPAEKILNDIWLNFNQRERPWTILGPMPATAHNRPAAHSPAL